MKISCFSDEIAPSLDEQIRVIKDLGIQAFEVRTIDDVPVLALSDRTLTETRHRADEEGLTITCVSSSLGKEEVGFPLQESLEGVRRASEAAEILGCPFIRVFSFFKRGRDAEECYRYAYDALSRMAEEAGKWGKVLVMEGGKDTVGGLGKVSEKLFREIDSPSLRCAFDAAAFLGEGEAPVDCLGLLKPYVSYVHIKDGRRGDPKKYVVGEGEGHYETLFSSIRDMDLTLSLEPHLSYAGAKRGFSGEMEFRRAHKALVTMLDKLQIAH